MGARTKVRNRPTFISVPSLIDLRPTPEEQENLAQLFDLQNSRERRQDEARWYWLEKLLASTSAFGAKITYYDERADGGSHFVLEHVRLNSKRFGYHKGRQRTTLGRLEAKTLRELIDLAMKSIPLTK